MSSEDAPTFTRVGARLRHATRTRPRRTRPGRAAVRVNVSVCDSPGLSSLRLREAPQLEGRLRHRLARSREVELHDLAARGAFPVFVTVTVARRARSSNSVPLSVRSAYWNRGVGQAEAEGVRRLHALRREVPVADPDVVVVGHLGGAIRRAEGPRAFGSGPEQHLAGEVGGRGHVLPLHRERGGEPARRRRAPRSARRRSRGPPPGPAARRAGWRPAASRQLAVSITPPTFRTTSSFFFRAWNAVGHVLEQRLLVGGQLEVVLARAVA